MIPKEHLKTLHFDFNQTPRNGKRSKTMHIMRLTCSSASTKEQEHSVHCESIQLVVIS